MIKKSINEMKMYVIEAYARLYNYHLNVARKIVESSSFITTLNQNPNYVMHYDDEYWAKNIKEEKDG